MLYLIPSFLSESALGSLPPDILAAVKVCQVFFVENERTARRFLKQVWKEMVIDDYEWVLADKETIHLPDTRKRFMEAMAAGKNIGIISEAGCPGVADPGQQLIALAHEKHFPVKPLVGPSSILLALMGSGLNGQQFSFSGYLPIDNSQRIKQLRELENQSAKQKSTQIFMETPYRNNALLDIVLKTCRPDTLLCIAANLTAADEFLQTRTIAQWEKKKPDLHKKPALFLLYANGA